MNSEEQEGVEIGNGENENCDEELRIDDNTETERCDEQFTGNVEIASGEPNEQGSDASDEQIIDGEFNEPDSDNIGVEDSDLDVENCANVDDEDDEEIQHLSIDAGVQVVASSSQTYSMLMQAPSCPSARGLFCIQKVTQFPGFN